MQTADMQTSAGADNAARRALWIALLTDVTIIAGFAFARATPFPALGALAAQHLNRRDAFALTGINWVGSQVIGCGFLHYPQSLVSFAWGAWIGIAAVGATATAIHTERLVRRAGWAAAAVVALLVAVAGYESVLSAGTAFLPSEPGAFGFRIVLHIVEVNAFAFAGLLILQRIGSSTGLAAPRGSGVASAA